MDNYYRRSSVAVSRNSRNTKNTNTKLKYSYKLGISIVVSMVTLMVALLRYDYFMVLVPSMIGIALLIGGVENDVNLMAYLLPFTTVLPMMCMLFTGEGIIRTILRLLLLIICMMMIVHHRSYLWKRSVMFKDIPFWYFILFNGVTNGDLGFVLLLSVVGKTLITAGITLGIIFAVRVLLTGEEIHKWTIQN